MEQSARQDNRLQLQSAVSRKNLDAIRQRLFALHRERLRRMLGLMRPSQQDFIILLPLLFHINHPMLPGFVTTTAPAGIPNFTPPHATLRTARTISRSFAYEKRARRHYRIQGIYLMGSMGTIAHTADSDFDVWLCHDPALSEDDVRTLRRKAAGIERWADELGLEVHIFTMHADCFRHGHQASLSHDSTGSTQNFLLLEEFYRSALFLAGRYPLWWLVPPEQESSYSEYAATLLRKRFVDPLECLDFGGLEAVPAEEFFGAALWQLFKGIEAPYKSVLKILLMEAYARDYPSPAWVSQQAKAAIYTGETDLFRLDPYVLAYREVEKHLLRQGERQRLELVRRCLYFKVGEPLSRPPQPQRRNWRQTQMRQLVREWGWAPEALLSLDRRPCWKVDRVAEERNRLVGELSHSYRILTEFARAHAGHSHIDPLELSLLGRKLYTDLEHRPGKIGLVNPGISHDLFEPLLSLHYAHTGDGNRGWFLYRGHLNKAQARATPPLKTVSSLIEMLAWCHLNRICSQATVFYLHPDDGPVRFPELAAILDTLGRLFPCHGHQEVALDTLARPARALSVALFVNVGADPMDYLAREGKQLTSERSDPLSFGAAHTNLVVNLEQLVVTSWGERLAHRYQGRDALPEALCRYLGMTLLVEAELAPAAVQAYSHSGIRGRRIAQRVAQVFNDLGRAFGPGGKGLHSRYILRAGDDCLVIEKGAGEFRWSRVESVDELTALLGEPQVCFRPVVFDRYALRDTALPTLFGHNLAERIQLFYLPRPQQMELWVLDEQGALFHQTLGSDEHRHLLVQQRRFLDSLLRYRSLFIGPSESGALLAAPEFFRLRRNLDADWDAHPEPLPKADSLDDYLELRLLTRGCGRHIRPFALRCGAREFSVLEHGEDLYARVARRILQLRHGHDAYPIYLTAVDTGDTDHGEAPSSIRILQLKKRVESRLNQALAAAADS